MQIILLLSSQNKLHFIQIHLLFDILKMLVYKIFHLYYKAYNIHLYTTMKHIP